MAKKSLGQNFLRNKSVVKNIVSASNLKNNDIVLEIGPGKGILTEELLKNSEKVIAIEKDDGLYKFLKEKFWEEIENKKLNLLHGDILKEKLPKLKKYKLISNIPYNITGEIIRKFLSGDNQPELITLLVQKEVAKRIVAADGKESILSISVKAYGKPKYIKKVSARDFSPAPKADSAILSIEKISKDFFKNINEKGFFDLVKKGFSQKRKKLSNTLKGLVKPKKSPVNLSLRAENLSLTDWKKLLQKI